MFTISMNRFQIVSDYTIAVVVELLVKIRINFGDISKKVSGGSLHTSSSVKTKQMLKQRKTALLVKTKYHVVL